MTVIIYLKAFFTIDSLQYPVFKYSFQIEVNLILRYDIH